jgi:hypothetical protein
VIPQRLVTGAGRPWADDALANAGSIYRIAAAENRLLDASESKSLTQGKTLDTVAIEVATRAGRYQERGEPVVMVSVS